MPPFGAVAGSGAGGAFGWNHGTGSPRYSHAGPGFPAVRPRPPYTSALGAYDTTAPTRGKVTPSSRASSPPRDAPTIPTRSPRTERCSLSQSNAVSKYSSGMFLSSSGRPGAAKYPSASVANPCEAKSAASGSERPPPEPPRTTSAGAGPATRSKNEPTRPRSRTAVRRTSGAIERRSSVAVAVAPDPAATSIRSCSGSRLRRKCSGFPGPSPSARSDHMRPIGSTPSYEPPGSGASRRRSTRPRSSARNAAAADHVTPVSSTRRERIDTRAPGATFSTAIAKGSSTSAERGVALSTGARVSTFTLTSLLPDHVQFSTFMLTNERVILTNRGVAYFGAGRGPHAKQPAKTEPSGTPAATRGMCAREDHDDGQGRTEYDPQAQPPPVHAALRRRGSVCGARRLSALVAGERESHAGRRHERAHGEGRRTGDHLARRARHPRTDLARARRRLHLQLHRERARPPQLPGPDRRPGPGRLVQPVVGCEDVHDQPAQGREVAQRPGIQRRRREVHVRVHGPSEQPGTALDRPREHRRRQGLQGEESDRDHGRQGERGQDRDQPHRTVAELPHEPRGHEDPAEGGARERLAGRHREGSLRAKADLHRPVQGRRVEERRVRHVLGVRRSLPRPAESRQDRPAHLPRPEHGARRAAIGRHPAGVRDGGPVRRLPEQPAVPDAAARRYHRVVPLVGHDEQDVPVRREAVPSGGQHGHRSQDARRHGLQRSG